MSEIYDESSPGMYKFTVLDDKGDPIGRVNGVLFKNKLDIGRIEVIENERQHGIGRKLWEAIIAKAKANGATELGGQLTLDSKEEADALSFYEKMGVDVDENGRLHKKL